MKVHLGLAALLWLSSGLAAADCVEGAMTMTRFSRVNAHTIALTGGYEGAIVIRTDCRIKRDSAVEVLKDSFCNEDEAVLYIDGEECAVEQVSHDDRFNEGKLWDDYDWDYKVN